MNAQSNKGVIEVKASAKELSAIDGVLGMLAIAERLGSKTAPAATEALSSFKMELTKEVAENESTKRNSDAESNSVPSVP